MFFFVHVCVSVGMDVGVSVSVGVSVKETLTTRRSMAQRHQCLQHSWHGFGSLGSSMCGTRSAPGPRYKWAPPGFD